MTREHGDGTTDLSGGTKTVVEKRENSTVKVGSGYDGGGDLLVGNEAQDFSGPLCPGHVWAEDAVKTERCHYDDINHAQSVAII